MNTYIYNNIIHPLEGSMNGTFPYEDLSCYSIHHAAIEARENMGLAMELRSLMLPYYRKLLLGDDSLFISKDYGHTLRAAIRICLEDEGHDIGSYFNDLDLVRCASNWGEQLCKYKNRRANDFIALVEILFRSNYSPDWNALYQQTCQLLSKANHYAHYKKEEMYCIIMAFLLISRKKELNDEQKAYYYRQIDCNWDFLKYMYSIMLNRIIGMRYENFAGVAHSLSTTAWMAPYLHIAYKAFKNRFDILCPEGAIDHHKGKLISEQAKVHLQKMEDVIKTNPASDELTPLCLILFPNKMSEVLGEDRPPTYAELEDSVKSLTISYNTAVEQLAEIVKSSVSIKDIEEAFAKFPSIFAMPIYNSLNSLLVGNKTWQKYASEIQQHILDRQVKANAATINNTYMEGSCQFQAGSSMNGDVKMGKGNDK